MNYQARAFQLSVLIHSVIIALAIIGSTFMGQHKKVVVLDLDLAKPVPAVKTIEDLTPESVINTESINPAARANLKEKTPARLPKESPRMPPVPENPPMVKLPEVPGLESSPVEQEIPDQGKAAKEGSSGIAAVGSGTNSVKSDVGVGKESAGTKYLNENFAYIRDKILENVRYPDEARRKEWQGKVLLSFIIMADGSVKALRVVQSSGYKMLDRSAIETVRDAAPYPRPPGEAQIVIPVSYRLE